jgi:hexosaminidase
MKKTLLATSLLLLSIASLHSQRAMRIWKNDLIPQPASLKRLEGYFELPQSITIITAKNQEVKNIATELSRRVQLATDRKVTTREGTAPASKAISILLTSDKSIPAEGYRLNIDKNGVRLLATTPAGIFYGVQTLYQLLPETVYTTQADPYVDTDEEIFLPTLTIEDKPRFGWRGLMLDVTRHFFTVPEVKDFIDQMVKYKFNMLHLHLSDDQGWRIEIKSLPKLTEVGAWRVDKTGTFGRFSNPTPDEPRTYGGFYTQADIKDLVKYARDRFVNILPEIDVPGHSLAAIASYPELTCTPGTYAVNSGEQLMVWPPGGHFYGLLDNSLCPANEKVYDFLDKVFGEIAQLFPFEYIHMGGDETARNFWEKSDAIKALMQKENLKNLDEVQSYFVKRVEKIIESKGKKMIGWDEILEGGLAPNAAVMSWRGMKGGIEAAKQNHEVVMSPTDFAYLDYMQGDAILEPPVYATLRLKKAYEFEPLPPGIDSKLIKGGQANLWTEQVYNTRHLQYMIWPRALAISETMWSPKEKKNWNDFAWRVEKQFPRFDEAEVKYSTAMFDPIFEASRKDSTITVKLSTEVDNLNIHYSFDNSFPDNYYPKYTAPLIVPKDAVTMKVITYRDKKPMGRMIVMPVSELKKRAK